MFLLKDRAKDNVQNCYDYTRIIHPSSQTCGSYVTPNGRIADNWERICMETITGKMRYYPRTHLAWLRKITKTLRLFCVLPRFEPSTRQVQVHSVTACPVCPVCKGIDIKRLNEGSCFLLRNSHYYDRLKNILALVRKSLIKHSTWR
jgi:hypothetical protein